MRGSCRETCALQCCVSEGHRSCPSCPGPGWAGRRYSLPGQWLPCSASGSLEASTQRPMALRGDGSPINSSRLRPTPLRRRPRQPSRGGSTPQGLAPRRSCHEPTARSQSRCGRTLWAELSGEPTSGWHQPTAHQPKHRLLQQPGQSAIFCVPPRGTPAGAVQGPWRAALPGARPPQGVPAGRGRGAGSAHHHLPGHGPGLRPARSGGCLPAHRQRRGQHRAVVLFQEVRGRAGAAAAGGVGSESSGWGSSRGGGAGGSRGRPCPGSSNGRGGGGAPSATVSSRLLGPPRGG